MSDTEGPTTADACPERGWGPVLGREFYARPTVEVARDLLGRVLAHDSAQGLAAGRIVETEAYLVGDPASHAVFPVRRDNEIVYETRRTARNRSMFGPPGHAYVYFTYGNHHCLNVVTVAEGVPEAVLIRALEPLAGLELMRARRRAQRVELLAAGPGRLCQAMGIDLRFDGSGLTQGLLPIHAGWPAPPEEIEATGRVGVRAARDWPLRLLIRSNRFVSKRGRPREDESLCGESST